MHPVDLLDYLESIATKLGELGGVFSEEPAIEVDFNESIGILRGQIAFAEGFRLNFDLVSAGPESFPDWLDYSFHMMDSRDVCVFRYDNAPHHPGFSNFPHHKHLGASESLQDCPRPSLDQIMEEVRQIVYP